MKGVPATLKAFARQIGAELTVMQGGEHWFHTETQMAFPDAWIRRQDFHDHFADNGEERDQGFGNGQ